MLVGCLYKWFSLCSWAYIIKVAVLLAKYPRKNYEHQPQDLQHMYFICKGYCHLMLKNPFNTNDERGYESQNEFGSGHVYQSFFLVPIHACPKITCFDRTLNLNAFTDSQPSSFFSVS